MRTKWIVIVPAVFLFLIFCFLIVYYSRQPARDVKVIHTVSYSNAVVFRTIQKFPSKIEGIQIPDPAKHVEYLLSGASKQAVVSITPFANALIAIDKNPSLKIIAGSGFNGISLISRVDSIHKLKGKKIGTSKGDSLESFLVEFLAHEGFNPNDYEIVYFTDPFEAIEAIKKGKIDAVTHVEPFATQLIEDNKMIRLSTSKSIWGDHPDAVVLTTKEIIEKYANKLQWFVDQMIITEGEIYANPIAVAENLGKKYYNLPTEKLIGILNFQYPKVDIRNYESFFIERGKTLQDLKYIDHPVSISCFDWRFLKKY